jgi:hypothetical protein
VSREQSSRTELAQPLRLNTHQAECRLEVLAGTADPDWWFADPSEQSDRLLAISICKRCPLREACLRESIEARIPYGIFGGLDASKRDRIIRGAAC